jgi:hypothetical protein
MSLVIILSALALLLGAAMLFIKAAAFVAEHGETLTKVLFATTVVLLILASIAHFKPELSPALTQACNKVADCIRLIVKPYTV